MSETRSEAGELPPVTTKFQLGSALTPVQEAFLEHYGFLHFERVARPEEVCMLRREHDRLEAMWLEEGRASINGIPLFFGYGAGGRRVIHRIPFSSRFSPEISAFVRDGRFEPIRRLIGEDARVGEDEKDGVVINRYLNVPGSIYKAQGWHTDGLRDLFYLRMPQRMLNVGMHFDDCTAENGGLRLIPGSHRQSFFGMCFGKAHFVSHGADPREIVVETEAGDLTVHDGRLWHRVARSQRTGDASLRRSMYVPYLTGPYEPKHERSKTPGYHHLGRAIRGLKTTAFEWTEGRRLRPGAA